MKLRLTDESTEQIVSIIQTTMTRHVGADHAIGGKWTWGRVDDRGPYIQGRALDVSRRIAEELGMVESGLAVVKVRVIE